MSDGSHSLRVPFPLLGFPKLDEILKVRPGQMLRDSGWNWTDPEPREAAQSTPLRNPTPDEIQKGKELGALVKKTLQGEAAIEQCVELLLSLRRFHLCFIDGKMEKFAQVDEALMRERDSARLIFQRERDRMLNQHLQRMANHGDGQADAV